MSHISIEPTQGVSLPYNSLTESKLAKLAESVLSYMNESLCEVSIILCNNSYIQDINRTYRNKDYATDVISFAYRDEPFPGESADESEYLGDIYLSLEKASEQAIEYGTSYYDEIKRLTVHSILHLLGYDHETNDSDAKKMFAKEDEILEALDVK